MRFRGSIIAVAIAAALCAPSAYAATGNITTVAGTGTSGATGDGGPATQAEISLPICLTTLADGSYLFCNQGSDQLRRVAADGTITRIAGSGVTGGFAGDGGPATDARMSAPNGILANTGGGFLFSDSNNNRVRQVGPDGIVNTIVGGPGIAYIGDGGPASAAELRFPADLARQADGGYLIADSDHDAIRRVDPGGTISTVAGTGVRGYNGDGIQATTAQLNQPVGVTAAPDGGFLIAEGLGRRVRRVGPDGVISTIAGNGTSGSAGDGGPATAATLTSPQRLRVLSDGRILIPDEGAHRVRQIATDGTISTFAGTGIAGYNGDDIPPGQAQLNRPFAVAQAPDGDVLIGDTNNHRVRRVDLGDPPPPPPPPDPPNPPSSVELGLTSVTRTPGDPNAVTAIVRRVRGSLAAGVEVRYAITGANPSTGRKTTDANGAVTIDWEGVRDGRDTITVWLDNIANGRQDTGEPSDSANVNWVLPVPEIRKTVNIEPVSGTVLVKLPKGAAVNKRDPWAVAAQNGFIPLEQAKNVPVNTIVNADRGRIELASAINKSSEKSQTGQFYSGTFQIKQTSGARPYTELRMNATLTCPKSTKKVDASGRTRRSRALWGNAKGRFRTRGRHSSASVRGTVWYTKDTCTTTTTVVREGTVIVNDFAKDKNVTVKAPKRYTARAKKKKIKSRS